MMKLREKDLFFGGRATVVASTLLLIAPIADVAVADDAAAAAAAVPRRLQSSTATPATPAQTYFVPLPESDLLASMERIVQRSFSNKNIQSLTSVSVAVEGTVLWYDHHEDGFEADLTNHSQSSTKIYGDGNPDNGCIEAIEAAMNSNDYSFDCTGQADVISGVNAFIFDNPNGVEGDRTPPYSDILHDGGDIIRSSFPIALARGAYPSETGLGSYLGGAVEIAEAETYGNLFHVPVGSSVQSQRFDMTELHLMARFDETSVYVKSGPGATETLQGTIDKGKTLRLANLGKGNIVRTTKPMQADLLTGDIGSDYEMRWYALLPVDQWSSEYYTPVSYDGRASTLVWLYNPDESNTITVTHEDKNGQVRTVDVSPGDTRSSSTNMNTGNKLYTSGGEPFFALTTTDNGRTYDWGHPLIPSDMLTSQSLVGWGYGCTGNSCGGSSPRSVVWVTPVSDATINIDFDSDGTVDQSQFTSALGQYRIQDTSDKDMTGAIVRAVDSNGDPVDIATAWGQVSQLSSNADSKALDMGTVLMPLPELAAYKEVALKDDRDGDGNFSPGDIMLYTIRITNSGQINLLKENFNVVDDVTPLFDQTKYIPNSTFYYDQTNQPTAIPDDVTPDTEFPLDGDGVMNLEDLPVGKAHYIQFEVEVMSADDPDEGLRLCLGSVTNTGRLHHNAGNLTDDFSVTTPLFFSGGINVVTTVYPGHDSGAACDAGNTGGTTYEGVEDEPITYCFVITNTGNTYLNETVLQDSLGNTLDTGTELLAPGENKTLSYETSISTSQTNGALVTASGRLFCSETDVSDSVSNTSGVDVTIIKLASSHPTSQPVASPTSSPSAAPTSIPTLSPTSSPISPPIALPTSSPTETVGIDISTIDQCRNFSQFFDFATYMEHFAFLARTTECINAKVYVNDRPLMQEEVDSGLLGIDWELMCDANVQGRGAREDTYIPSDNCTTVEVPAAVRMHFYITMEYIAQAGCDGLGGGGGVGSSYNMIYSVFTVQNDVCPI